MNAGTTANPVRVLYVDDSKFDRELVRDALEREAGGFVLTETASRREFEAALTSGHYDLVLTDFHILGFTGLDVISAVRAARPDLPVVVVTGTGSEQTAVEAMKLGAADYVIKDPGHIRRLASTIHNVLDRHRAKLAEARATEALLQSQARLEFAMNAGGMGTFDWDVRTGRLVGDRQLARLFGMTLEELEGSAGGLGSRIHPDDLPDLERAVSAAREARGPFEDEYRVIWADGSVHWLVSRGMFAYDGGGEAVRMSGVVMDVTPRRAAEETARNQQAELAHLLRLNLLSQLVSGLAHEINQPLSAISNFAGAALTMQENGTLTGEYTREVLSGVGREAHRAAEIIRRLRGFMKKRPPEVAAVDLNAVVAEAVGLMRGELQRKRVKVRTQLAAHLPPLRVDAVQIQQVLVNLIQNAVDAMAEVAPGGRSLEISTIGSVEAVIVRVSDNGAGISPDALGRVFDSFFSTKSHGLGMGLNISRSIVESHGGRLTAANNPQSGATFEFILPLTGERNA